MATVMVVHPFMNINTVHKFFHESWTNLSDLAFDMKSCFIKEIIRKIYMNCYNFYNSRLIFFVLCIGTLPIS